MNTNETPETELAEVRRLFVKAIVDELKSEKPSSAVLNIAQRFIAAERDAMPLTPATAPAPATTPSAPSRFPFPAPAKKTGVADDGDQQSGKPWERLNAAPFASDADF
jgi:hypothetical protein